MTISTTRRPTRPGPRPPRPPRRTGAGRRRRRQPDGHLDTRQAVFAAAADAFSARGFDGVTIDDIAGDAGVNKAMIYYHFADKLALYRAIVSDMFRAAGARLAAIAAADEPADQKIHRFVDAFVELTSERPWAPPLMLREIAEGAPHLDMDTLSLMRKVFLSFERILSEGEAQGRFRRVNPVLAYMSALGPLLLNAARERAGARPGRRQLPMFVEVPREELMTHMRGAIGRVLAKEP